MGIYERERVSSGMDKVGKEICYHSCLLHTSEWAFRGSVDSPTAQREAGMPTCSTTLCFCSRYTCRMHHASVYSRLAERIPNTELFRGHSSVTTCR